MDSKIDLSNFSVEQLREIIALKEGRPVADGSVQRISSPAELFPKEELSSESKCSFIPRRADQVPCRESVIVVNYGDKQYCAKHRRSVQATSAKKEWDELNTPVVTSAVSPIVSTPIPTPVVIPTPTESTPVLPTPVVENVKKTKIKRPATPKIIRREIKQNKWGRYEDLETGIIFDPKSRAAYGVQDRKTGKVLALTSKDVKICEKYRWKYHVIQSQPPKTLTPKLSRPKTPKRAATAPKAPKVEELSESITSEDSSEARGDANEERGGREIENTSAVIEEEENEEIVPSSSGEDLEEICQECENLAEECTCLDEMERSSDENSSELMEDENSGDEDSDEMEEDVNEEKDSEDVNDLSEEKENSEDSEEMEENSEDSNEERGEANEDSNEGEENEYE